MDKENLYYEARTWEFCEKVVKNAYRYILEKIPYNESSNLSSILDLARNDVLEKHKKHLPQYTPKYQFSKDDLELVIISSLLVRDIFGYYDIEKEIFTQKSLEEMLESDFDIHSELRITLEPFSEQIARLESLIKGDISLINKIHQGDLEELYGERFDVLTLASIEFSVIEKYNKNHPSLEKYISKLSYFTGGYLYQTDEFEISPASNYSNDAIFGLKLIDLIVRNNYTKAEKNLIKIVKGSIEILEHKAIWALGKLGTPNNIIFLIRTLWQTIYQSYQCPDVHWFEGRGSLNNNNLSNEANIALKKLGINDLTPFLKEALFDFFKSRNHEYDSYYYQVDFTSNSVNNVIEKIKDKYPYELIETIVREFIKIKRNKKYHPIALYFLFQYDEMKITPYLNELKESHNYDEKLMKIIEEFLELIEEQKE
ncbi:MAG: hypothetical protein JXA54_03425 [Candidatus Heimdallarchaeota archaeon]|nr:hypothetical protein [Candidatus Heimdallarchaeota archaeon]